MREWLSNFVSTLQAVGIGIAIMASIVVIYVAGILIGAAFVVFIVFSVLIYLVKEYRVYKNNQEEGE